MSHVRKYLTGLLLPDALRPGLYEKLDGTVWARQADGSDVQLGLPGIQVYKFDLAFDTPGLLEALPLFDVEVGDIFIGATVFVSELWNGVDPSDTGLALYTTPSLPPEVDDPFFVSGSPFLLNDDTGHPGMTSLGGQIGADAWHMVSEAGSVFVRIAVSDPLFLQPGHDTQYIATEATAGSLTLHIFLLRK